MQINRKTLFRKSKPVLRSFVVQENGELGPDVGILWAAYRRKSFDFPEMDEKTFTAFILNALSRFNTVWMMEDDHKGFRSGRGPVCAIGINSNGWKILPQVFWFSWATNRNKLRCSVAFVQKTRYDKTVGCCEFNMEQSGTKLASHVTKFIPTLRYVGKVWFGSPSGDQFIYSIKGAKNAGIDGSGKTTDGVQRDDNNGQRRENRSKERKSNISRENSESIEERSGNA
jgi:hypothetical protein